MRPSLVLIWIISGVVSLPAVGIAGMAALAHRRTLTDERSKLRQVQQYAETVGGLPSQLRESAGPEASEMTLAERVTGVLSSHGLSHRVLQEVSPESSVAHRGVETRHAALTFAPITLPELGRFLAGWLADEPAWTVTSIDLTPIRGADVEPGGDLPLRAVLTMATIGMQDQGDAP